MTSTSQIRAITRWFNTSAFAIAAPWTLGDAPRYFSDLRAPNYDNWDMGIQKFFPIKEDLRLQFRVDFFNAFNHANFYAPNMSFGSGEFGKITNSIHTQAYAGSAEVLLVMRAKHWGCCCLLFDPHRSQRGGIFARAASNLSPS